MLLLALFLLGGAGAPALDAWLHAAADQRDDEWDGERHDCVWCRSASTRPAPNPPPPALEPLVWVSAPERPLTRVVTVVVAPACRRPPARAPPAA